MSMSPRVLATEVAAGLDHTCALVDGAVSCWGNGDSGELGGGARRFIQAVPAPTVGPAMAVTSLATYRNHVCAIVSDSGLWCWGSDWAGQASGVNSGPDRAQLVPAAVPNVSPVDAMATGVGHSCAASGSVVRCWGSNRDGELGRGSTMPTEPIPAAVMGLAGADALAAGQGFSCALPGDGSVLCWGNNDRYHSIAR